MKTSVSFAYCLAIAMMVFAPYCSAQQPYVSGATGAAGQIYEPTSGVATGMAAYQMPFPGRIWFGTNIADKAVGTNGIYASLGMKTRLFEDRLDGRWLTEARLHQSLDGGGFFTNIGLERVFSLEAAKADVAVSAWFDYDAGTNEEFSHSFFQVGVNAAIKSERWDLIGNGYFPVGTQNYTQGDPNGIVPFYRNRIVLIPGIDTALEGFDATLRVRPKAFAKMNGSIDIGGYGYSSDIVSFFGGGRARLNGQFWNGWIVSSEISYDERFDLTGGVNFTYMFGLNARGSEYAGIGRDLERTVRNDRVVRYNQEVVYAIDPATGRAYNVWHAKNDADLDNPPSLQDGTFENPFLTTAAAENASGERDIIWVDEGDGTTQGYDTEIQLRNGQQLLGDGVAHRIAIGNGAPFGPFYELVHNLDNNRPSITSNLGDAAVQLANNNVVRGFIIDGNQSAGTMGFGIQGRGFARSFRGAVVIDPVNGNPIHNVIVEDNVINGAVKDGVHIEFAKGELLFRNNTIGETSVGPGADRSNGGSGILIEDFVDHAEGRLVVQNNILSGNGRGEDGLLGGHGLALFGYQLMHRDIDAPLDDQEVGVLIENNIVQNNLKDGILLAENLYAESDGTPVTPIQPWRPVVANATTDIDIIGNTTIDNGENGIHVTNPLVAGLGRIGSGRLRVLEAVSTDNAGAGVRIQNWTNTDRLNAAGESVADTTVIASRFDGPSSVITGNGRGVEVLLGNSDLPAAGWKQDLIVQGATIDGNLGTGVRATVSGVGTRMNSSIIDNLSISGNGANGITVSALGGADHTTIIENSAAAIGPTQLELIQNGGSGIDILAGNDSNTNQSFVKADIRNVLATGSGNHGINVSASDFAHVDVFVENVATVANGAHGMNVNVRTTDTLPVTPDQVNTIVIKDAVMDVNSGNGLTVRTYGGLTDVLVTGSTFNGNQGGLGRVENILFPFTRTGFGVEVTATNDDPLLPGDQPNFTRFQIFGSQMNGNARSGLTMQSRENANLYATVDSNEMSGNGFTFGEFDFLFFKIPYTRLNDRGVDISAYDSSRFSVDMSNNSITGNGEEGVYMSVASTDSLATAAELNVWLKDNAITGNDIRNEEIGGVPVFIAQGRDILMANGTNPAFGAPQNNGLFNLAMSNNAIAGNPATLGVQEFFNWSAPNRFNIGLDGVTNGFTDFDVTNDAIQGNGFTFTSPYDNIVAQELFDTWVEFLAEGFPLTPPPSR